MELEIMQQIITMIGGATESAVTIAMLWIVGGYLVTLTGWGMFVYLIKFLTGVLYKFFTTDVSKSEHLEVKDRLSSVAQELKNKESEFYSKIQTMKSEHKVEVEKIKHLYKILKESSNDR